MREPARKLRRYFGGRKGEVRSCIRRDCLRTVPRACFAPIDLLPAHSRGSGNPVFLRGAGSPPARGRADAAPHRTAFCPGKPAHQKPSPALTRALYIPPLRLPIVNSGRRDTDDQADLRRAGPGRARPCLFLSRTGQHRAGAGRSRHRAARPARLCRRRVGRAGCARSPTRQSAQRYHQPARYSAAAGRAAPVHRLGRRLHAVAARHGAADGAAHGRVARPRARAHRGADCGAVTVPYDRGAGAGSGAARRWPAAQQGRSGRTGERFAQRD